MSRFRLESKIFNMCVKDVGVGLGNVMGNP